MPKEEKSRMERAALKEMCEVLGGGMRGMQLWVDIFVMMSVPSYLNIDSIKLSFYFYFVLAAAEEIKELWEEYENNSSIEANLVKDFDKVCTFLHFECNIIAC